MDHLTTVGELLEYLKTQPLDRPIIMSSDAEGNRISSLWRADEVMIDPEDVGKWSIEFYNTPESMDGDDSYEEDDYPPEDAVRVVLLGPVN